MNNISQTNNLSSGDGTRIHYKGLIYKLEMDTTGKYIAYPITPTSSCALKEASEPKALPGLVP